MTLAASALVTGILLAFQLGSGTPGSRAVEQLEKSVTQPVPRVPTPAPARPDMVWVPDRQLTVPGQPGTVLVPGHWERRISEREFFVPPLTVCNSATGECTAIPAGTRGPADTRNEP